MKMHHFEGENTIFFLGRGTVPSPDLTPLEGILPPRPHPFTPQTTFLATVLLSRDGIEFLSTAIVTSYQYLYIGL